MIFRIISSLLASGGDGQCSLLLQNLQPHSRDLHARCAPVQHYGNLCAYSGPEPQLLTPPRQLIKYLQIRVRSDKHGKTRTPDNGWKCMTRSSTGASALALGSSSNLPSTKNSSPISGCTISRQIRMGRSTVSLRVVQLGATSCARASILILCARPGILRPIPRAESCTPRQTLPMKPSPRSTCPGRTLAPRQTRRTASQCANRAVLTAPTATRASSCCWPKPRWVAPMGLPLGALQE